MCATAERAHPDHPGFAPGTIYHQFHEQRYQWAALQCLSGYTLDAPCGCGWGTDMLPKPVIGMDVCPGAVEYGKQKFDANCIVGNMLETPFADGVFMNVVCLEGIEHLRRIDAGKFLKEARRITAKGGRLIVTIPLEKGHPVNNPHHLEAYDLLSARTLMDRDWAATKLTEVRQVNGIPILWGVYDRKD
jgi:SAM-dependent methyltransferase